MSENVTGNPSWNRTASWRRILLILLILGPTIIAARTMAALLPSRGGTPLEAVLVAVFAVLFAWISVGFWTAAMGFFLLLSKNNRFSVSRAVAGKNFSIDDPSARTAVLIPIYNEDVKRVLRGSGRFIGPSGTLVPSSASTSSCSATRPTPTYGWRRRTAGGGSA